MILAAGRGERLRPLTNNCPKPLIEIAGKPIMQYHLERLRVAGINEVVVNVSYYGDMIKQKFGDGHDFNLSIRYSTETEPLEVAGGIINALPLLGTEPFLIVNGDIWTDYPFAQLINYAQHFNELAHIVLVDTTARHPQGDYGLQGNRLLLEAAKKYIYSGIALFSPQFFANTSSGKQFLPPMLNKAIENNTITAEYFSGEWYDLGTPESIQQLNEKLHGSTD